MIAWGYHTKEAALEAWVDKMSTNAEEQGNSPYLLDELALTEVSDCVEAIDWAIDGAMVGVCLGYIVEMKGVFFPSVLVDEVFGARKGALTQIML